MSWRTRDRDLLRIEFIMLALQPNIVFSALCNEFSISRTTGYKWLNRYKVFGITGLKDRSHRPHNSPTKLDGEVVLAIIRLRNEYPFWGPKKLRELLILDRICPESIPSVSSVGRVLREAGMTRPKGRGRPRKNIQTTPLETADATNDVWTADFKGWWRTQNNEKCEPLTVRDLFSKYILCIKPLKKKRTEDLIPIFEELFDKYGLPKTIRTDNGSPFASTQSPHGLTRLSAWWRLNGIKLDRITPGHPQENGSHERMHRDIAIEIEGIPSKTLEEEAIRLERWRREYNERRPHEALNMQMPADLYRPSERIYQPSRKFIYPLSYELRKIKKTGEIRFKGKQKFISGSLALQEVGLERIDMSTYNVWFCNLLLGRLSVSSDSSLSFDEVVQNPMKPIA